MPRHGKRQNPASQPKETSPPGQAPVTELFQQAHGAHLAGLLIEAEEGYRVVLSRNEHHADALQLSGILQQQMGNPREAEILIRRALELHEEPFFLGNLGVLLKETGRLPEAEAAYRRALELNPDYAEAHYNLGVLLQEAKRLCEAEAAYRRALELKPGHAAARHNIALLNPSAGFVAPLVPTL